MKYSNLHCLTLMQSLIQTLPFEINLLQFFDTSTDWRRRSDHFFVEHRNYSIMFTDYGIRIRTKQNRGDIHTAEDLAGWKGPIIYLSNVWTILACCDHFGKYFVFFFCFFPQLIKFVCLINFRVRWWFIWPRNHL